MEGAGTAAVDGVENLNEQIDISTEEKAPEGPPPCPILASLYKSTRPRVELTPGVNLSPIINACYAPKESKKQDEETDAADPAGEDSGAPPPPSFDPAAIEYTELPKRLSKAASFLSWNAAMVKLKVLENELDSATKAEKEAKQAAVDEMKQQIADIQAQITEVKSGIMSDPSALSPVVQMLFDLVDAGLTTFDVDGPYLPWSDLRGTLGVATTRSYYDLSEKLLGSFKRRFITERGNNNVQILTRLLPNSFNDGYSPAAVEALIDQMRTNIAGPEGTPEPLDLVQLCWWDYQQSDILPTLKVLQGLSIDKMEVDTDSNTVTITEPRKINAIGLIDCPHNVIKAALQSGVKITSVQLSFGLHDRTQYDTLMFCQEHNIKVFSRDGCMAGLVSPEWIGAPCPDSLKTYRSIPSMTLCMNIIDKCGGWDKVQKVLTAIKNVAEKHSVKMQTVALRWQIDAGTFPVASISWGPQAWGQFGYSYWQGDGPGVDAALFQKESFLDDDDMASLSV